MVQVFYFLKPAYHTRTCILFRVRAQIELRRGQNDTCPAVVVPRLPGYFPHCPVESATMTVMAVTWIGNSMIELPLIISMYYTKPFNRDSSRCNAKCIVVDTFIVLDARVMSAT